MSFDHEPVVVHPDELNKLESRGVVREVAFDEELPPVEGQRILVQHTYNERGEFSNWHIHPNYMTYGYQIAGQLRVEYGPGGSKSIEAGPGDFERIPPGFIQREGAIGDTPREGVGIRIGSGIAVIDVDGPEPEDSQAATALNDALAATAALGRVESSPPSSEVAKEPVVVHAHEVDKLESPGVLREVAFEEVLPIVDGQRVLVERTHNDPGDFSGWHIHPNYTTYGYQLTGRLRVEYGPGGSKSIEAGAGDFVRIPPGIIHREGAIGDSRRSGIGILIGNGPAVVDVDGPEPAESDAIGLG